MLGLGLDQVLAEDGTRPGRAKSVIYIFLSGVLSQIDSFDMKPDGPVEIRGTFREIATRTPGLRICAHLPRLAACSDKWALCRSITHDSNEHSSGHHIMLTGRSEMPPGFDPRMPKDSDSPSTSVG